MEVSVLCIINNYTELDSESEASAPSSPSPDCPAGPSPLSSALPSAVTESLFTDIDELVEEASDVVCSTGLEEVDVVVEDDSRAAEERRVAWFLGTGCKCRLNNGSPCYTLFSPSQLQAALDDFHQLTRDQLDMVVMGQLMALCQRDPDTQKTKAKNVARQRTNTQYRFGGHRICQTTFLFLHTISVTRFDAIKRSWLQNGVSPRVRSPNQPHNTTRLSDVQHVVRFILQYAEDHAILLPGRIPGYKRDDVQLLPSSTTKRQVWEVYHEAASGSPDTKAVCYSLFCSLWQQLTPQVVVTSPMSDLCWVCQQQSTLIMRSHNSPVEEKSEVLIINIHNVR